MASRKSVDSKGAIRKTIYRNIDVPITTSVNHPNVVKYSKIPEIKSDQNKSKEKKINKEIIESKDYKLPKLCSTLEVTKKIENLKLHRSGKPIKTEELTPRSKIAVAQQLTKKLNFHPDQPVFRNLIPINVNDSILIPEERKPIIKKYIPRPSKDPIPELSDFLDPIEPLQYTLPLYNKPITLRKPINDTFNALYELHVNYHPDA